MSENTPQEGQQGSTPEYTPIQEQAMSQGWVPKDEYKGDPEKWVDAGEFIRRGELFTKIEHQNKRIKDMERALHEITRHHSQVKEVEYQRALATLRAQKKTALEEGDADAVIAAEEAIDAVKEHQRAAQYEPQVEQSGEAHPEFVEWKTKNAWYENDPDLNAWANGLAPRYVSQGLSPSQVLQKLAEEVKVKFPNKFQNPRQNRPSAVEGGGPRGTSSSSFQLTPEERRVMQTFVRQGVMTEEQYIADLKKIKGI